MRLQAAVNSRRFPVSTRGVDPAQPPPKIDQRYRRYEPTRLILVIKSIRGLGSRAEMRQPRGARDELIKESSKMTRLGCSLSLSLSLSFSVSLAAPIGGAIRAASPADFEPLRGTAHPSPG